MVHPSEATLLILLHGELDRDLMAEAREHVASCAVCAAKLAELREADATVAGLLDSLDHPVPGRLPPAVTRAPRLVRSALAASITLLAAGVAAAAVPGTPIHRWVQEQLGHTSHRGSERPGPAPATALPAPASEQAASGIEVPAIGGLTISFARPEEGGALVVVPSGRSNVSLRAFGGGVAYQVSAGRIGVDNRRPAGRYQLEVPTRLERLTVLIGKQVVFRSQGERSGRAGRDTIPLSIDRVRR
jgi:anti-sigma factor RsiW